MAKRAVEQAGELLDAGKLEQAASVARRALAAAPGDPELCALMGFIAFAEGNYPQAEYYSRQVVARVPRDAGALANLGAALVGQGKFEVALEPLKLVVQAGDVAARASYASALGRVGRWLEARAVLEEGVALAPGDERLAEELGAVLHETGRVDEALPLLEAAVARAGPGASPGLLQRWAGMHTYAPGVSVERAYAAHVRCGRALEAGAAALPAVERRGLSGRALRVGLLSPDLRRHSVAAVIEPFIEHADRGRLWVACYSTATREDEVSARLSAKADLWRSCAYVGDGKLAGVIRLDRIDVLVDLAGLSAGQRVGVLAHRPAPVQVTYAGYPATTGTTCVDYRVVDGITDPAGAGAYSTERLLRLPVCSTVYRPPEGAPGVGPLPADANGFVTFAAFGSLLKYSGRVMGVWSRVLREVPGSRLVIKHLNLEDGGLRGELVARFERAGAPAGSVVALPPAPGMEGHLGAYGGVDIQLDTFPYNGTVTTLESLFMGVPVVSLAGQGTAARMGLSLLGAAGLGGLCAEDEDAYVRLAVALAGDRERLRGLRASLRARLMASPLCDGPGFSRRMEDVLYGAWHGTEGGDAPAARR